MKMNNQILKYRVRDLGEASVQLMDGHKLSGITKEGNICWFEFDDLDDCKRTSDLFWFGEFMVNAKSYYDAITRLKSRIFQME